MVIGHVALVVGALLWYVLCNALTLGSRRSLSGIDSSDFLYQSNLLLGDLRQYVFHLYSVVFYPGREMATPNVLAMLI